MYMALLRARNPKDTTNISQHYPNRLKLTKRPDVTDMSWVRSKLSSANKGGGREGGGVKDEDD
jgi:hypothetical protein